MTPETHKCQCSGRGECPVFNMFMSAREHEKCSRHEGISRQESDSFIEALYRTSKSEDFKKQTTEAFRVTAPEIYIRPLILQGVGTELKKLASWFGQYADAGCNCQKHADEMDRNGPYWCRNNLDTIVGWLQEEASRRKVLGFSLDKVPGFNLTAKGLVQLAIHNTESRSKNVMKWSYGVTTVKQRLEDGLLERTLNSLRSAGFDNPRLFIDGDNSGFERFGLEMTHRNPVIRTFGNWYLALLELTIREPAADRYALFQDDFVTYLGLREYLELVPYPDKGYLNLYTFPCNQQRCNGNGWFESDQFGKGAVAIVMDNEAAHVLLTQRHMADRAKDPIRGHRAIDGGIVDSFKKAGYKEYIHNPTLVQHTGHISSMGNSPHQQAVSFRGEQFNAMELLKA